MQIHSKEYFISASVAFALFPFLHATAWKWREGEETGFGLDTASEGTDFSGLAAQL